VEKPADLVPTSDFDARALKYAGEYYSARSNFSGFEKMLTLFAPISITVDENKNVILSQMGESSQYVEVEPGLLVNREHPDNKMVLKEENGQITLHPTGPWVYIKKPWYASLSLHLLILIGGALLFLIVLFRWLGSFFTGLVRREPRSLLARLARLSGGLFALVYLIIFLVLAAVLMDVNPAYGVPNIFFESPAGLDTFMVLPLTLGILAIIMIVFALIAWIKRFWTFGARLSYTFLTLFALAIVWSLTYWNLLLLA
jgi:hypothetical protein